MRANRLIALCSSTSRSPPSTDTAVAPIKRAGLQRRSDGGRDVVERTGQRRGDEHDGEVRRRADLLEHLADHLAGGVGRKRVLGERGGEAACSGRYEAGGSRVNGTVVTGPLSMRTLASTVS